MKGLGFSDSGFRVKVFREGLGIEGFGLGNQGSCGLAVVSKSTGHTASHRRAAKHIVQ